MSEVNTKKRIGYTVFGKVLDKKSMHIVDRIKKVKVVRKTMYSDYYKRDIYMHNVPEDDIIIKTVRIIRPLK